jgi:hypothetical protein
MDIHGIAHLFNTNHGRPQPTRPLLARPACASADQTIKNRRMTFALLNHRDQKHEPQPANELTITSPLATFAHRVKSRTVKTWKAAKPSRKTQIASQRVGDFCTFGARLRGGAKVGSPQVPQSQRLTNIAPPTFGAARRKSHLAPCKFLGYVTMANQFRFKDCVLFCLPISTKTGRTNYGVPSGRKK